ncbi:hypothetical protein CDAR_64711 [Caerostris darwini]|uniref:Uncharacterized protein n=1 Tax=Caerostris darwini TaxID=1538125 RepID=A0AAV4TPW2_9ARAC|nr:hypothetical protein CDAR_64711 [Caerostris darwini]
MYISGYSFYSVFMYNKAKMCPKKPMTDELVEMILTTSRKQLFTRNNLRVEVLLKSTHELLDKELKEKQQMRKRKWEEIRACLSKRMRTDIEDAKIDDIEMAD